MSLNVNTRPAVENPTTPEEWINDEVAAAARALWEKNPKASPIECALIAATDAIRPMRRQVLESVVEDVVRLVHEQGLLTVGESDRRVRRVLALTGEGAVDG